MALTKISTPAIKDEAITLAKLLHGDSNNNGKFLRANNGADPSFESVITDLVNDSSPQLGANLDTNDKLIKFGDAESSNGYTGLRFGDDDDLWIYHTPQDLSIIRQNTSGKTLVIQNAGGDTKMETLGTFKVQSWESEDIAIFNRNGSVELYYDNSKKFQTTSNGVAIGDKLAIGGTLHPAINANADDLVVGAGTGYSGITIYSGTTYDGNIFFADGTSGDQHYRGFLQYQHNTDRMYFGTAASTHITLDENGLMGLGTTTPSSYNGDANKLVLKESGVNTGMTIATTGNNNCNIFFADSDVDGASEYAGYIQYSHAQDELRLGASANNRVKISQNEVEIVDGDLKIGTSGHGINFDGFGAGGVSNLLDDYEEGTFTPSIVSGRSGSISYSQQVGIYTKIGNKVFCQIYMNISGGTNAASALYIGGLPFNNINTTSYEGGGFHTYQYGFFTSSGAKDNHPWVMLNNNQVIFHRTDNGSQVLASDTSTAQNYLIFHVQYITA